MTIHYKAYIEQQERGNKDIDHSYILQYCDGVDQDYIEKYKDIDFNYILEHYPIREEYLELLIKNDLISGYTIHKQKLSIDLYKKYKDRIILHCFINYQKLSENYITEIFDNIIDKHCLSYLFKYQILSESFLRSIKEHWINNDDLKRYIVNYNRLSNNFRKEFDLDQYLSEDNWLYKSTEFKKQELIETKRYECFDDYFIAYKAIRKNRYSLFNFQYKYMEGNIYEAKADYNIDDNYSCGLFVGIKEYCEKYGDNHLEEYIIVKCKVKYDDISAMFYDGLNVRCRRIEILD